MLKKCIRQIDKRNYIEVKFLLVFSTWVKRDGDLTPKEKPFQQEQPTDTVDQMRGDLPGRYIDRLHGRMDDRPYEVDLKPLGRTFPRP